MWGWKGEGDGAAACPSPVLASETSDGSEPKVRHKLSVFRPELIETFVK